MENFVIRTHQLKKIFSSREKGTARDVEAVAGIDLDVQQNEIFGLLGPNGAGKTTAMRMLCTLLSPTSGDATVVEYDLQTQHRQIRGHIGYVSQKGGMEKRQTGRENLLLQARLYGMERSNGQKRVNEVIEALGLSSYADRRASTYSGGQKRIFDLASGIIHKPKLLFLDEPTTGLDPHSRTRVWEEVKKLHREGTAIFLTTHYLEEADMLCSRVAIIDYGKIVALDNPAQLKHQISGDSIILGFERPDYALKAMNILQTQSFIDNVQNNETALSFYVTNGDEAMPLIMNIVHQNDIPLKTIQLARPTLDDVFLKLTGRTMRESAEE
ncbi:MAG: ATP-binding cassette domain-containing protein [Bacteroidota bacterium]